MKNNLLYLFITIALTSCSTYNYQSNKQDIAIYELKTEPKEALFTERKYTKGSHTLKFYIHDLDDSTFQCNNIQIYDSTLAGELEAVESDIVRDSLNRENSYYLKNEVHINIDRRCTNKNSKVYLETNEIVKLQSYNFIKQQKKFLTKKVRTILIVYFSLSLIGGIGFVIWLNSLFSGW